ncbi:MAG TPA: HU family DNA-binding protein [Myxococcota bacterium]|jgi:DNA-binding protein HU-beta|nr:HU family DNA-binding protein [Myxococcota bacterium]
MPSLTKAASLTKAELIELVTRTKGMDGLSKKAAEVLVDAVFDHIEKSLRKGKKFTYPRFGTFTRIVRRARKGRDPRTKAEIQIPRTTTIKFTPAQSLKTALNRRA